ncbi:MAG: hypothetical protein IPN84_06120 [Sphingomonadales bacterium]|nr:hypothetical protein [Sphingomonadales bacterium]
MGLALAIPLIFGGLSPSSPIYQRSIAIGQFAAKLSAEQAAAQEAACLNGAPPDSLRIIKVKGKARDGFAAYWKRVQGGRPASVADLFHAGVKPGWITDDQSRLARPADAGLKSDDGTLAAHRDRFAGLGFTLDEARVNFVLSGDQKAAIGQWAVLNTAGQIAGIYDATFIQRKKVWKLTRLQWTGDSIGFRPPRQFCHAPDDVMPHRLARARAARIAAEEALVKAEARLAQAEAALAAARGEQLQALAQEDLERARKSEGEARASASSSAYALESAEQEAQSQKAADDRALQWQVQRGI